MPTVNLTKRLIEATKPPAKGKLVLNDSKVTGLSFVRHATGKGTWNLYYRTQAGQQRRPKLGDYGVLTVAEARARANEWLAEVAAGGDPSRDRRRARAAPTVGDLWERYWNEHALPNKKPSSRAKDAANWRLHIHDRLASKKVAEVTRQDIRDLKFEIGKRGHGVANRCLALLSKMCNFAEYELEFIAPGTNPVRGIKKFPEKPLERYLGAEEFRRLGEALELAASDGFRRKHRVIDLVALDIIWFVLATGCRVSTALTLRRSEVQLGDTPMMHPDTKNGLKHIALNELAVATIRRQPIRAGNPFVFAAPEPRRKTPTNRDWQNGHISRSRLEPTWKIVRAEAGLEGVRIHDLRHSFAAAAVAGGFSLRTIGRMLGNTSPAAIQRYAHVPDAYAQRVAAEMGTLIGTLTGGNQK